MERCDFVRLYCADAFAYIPMMEFHTCILDQNLMISLIITLMAILIIIRVLEYVCANFLSSAIAKISEYMKLTEAMAGSTLVAFSNGATDVITAMIASGSSDSIDMMIGALYGASCFAITIILTVVIFSSKNKIIKDVYSPINIVKQTWKH